MSSSSDASTRVVRLPATLSTLGHLATMLEKLDRSGQAPDPEQYRQLVARVNAELEVHAGHPALPQLLGYFPATAELYENKQYAVAGLCLTSLERSVLSEQEARRVIQSFMQH